MTAGPKSPKEIVKEALEAFDIEFNELVSEFKSRLDAVIRKDGVNSDAYKLLEEIRQIKFERNELGKRLSDRTISDRLTGRIKNVRLKIEKFLGSDK